MERYIMYTYTRLSKGNRQRMGTLWYAFKPCWCKQTGLFVCMFSLIGVVIVLWFVIPEQLFLPEALVQTSCGESRGIIHPETNVFVFKGIGYAEPPIGEKRWKPPEAPSTGNCHNLDAEPMPCAQVDDMHAPSKVIGSEDCLYLNIYSPHISPLVPAQVMVWIHGGNLQKNAASTEWYHPDAKLARKLGVVFVNIQYRLNVFGWFVSSALPKASGHNGNYGLQDQILALQWVQQNIHKFGGDPDKVSIFGQSSGGTSVLMLLSTPYTLGLFHRAWAISSSPRLPAATYEQAQTQNDALLQKVDCSDSECLMKLNTSEVLHLIYPEWDTSMESKDVPEKGKFDPVLAIIDGDILLDPEETWQRPYLPNVPLLLGTTAQEVDFDPDPSHQNWTQSELFTYLDDKLSTFQQPNLNASRTLSMYASENKNPDYIFTTLTTDIRVTCLSNVLCGKMAEKRRNVYRYIVTAAPSSPVHPFNIPSVSKYAYHCLDILAYFDSFRTFMNAQESDFQFRDLMQSIVMEFVVSGVTSWKNYPEEIALVGTDLGIVDSYHQAQCDYWQQFGLLDYSWMN